MCPYIKTKTRYRNHEAQCHYTLIIYITEYKDDELVTELSYSTKQWYDKQAYLAIFLLYIKCKNYCIKPSVSNMTHRWTDVLTGGQKVIE